MFIVYVCAIRKLPVLFFMSIALVGTHYSIVIHAKQARIALNLEIAQALAPSQSKKFLQVCAENPEVVDATIQLTDLEPLIGLLLGLVPLYIFNHNGCPPIVQPTQILIHHLAQNTTFIFEIKLHAALQNIMKATFDGSPLPEAI